VDDLGEKRRSQALLDVNPSPRLKLWWCLVILTASLMILGCLDWRSHVEVYFAKIKRNMVHIKVICALFLDRKELLKQCTFHT
jgi:hypothetical protein